MEYCLHTKSEDLSGNGSNRSNYVKLHKPKLFALMTTLCILSIGIIALSLRISFSPDFSVLQPVERNLALDVQDIKRKISALENSINRLQRNHSDIEKIGDSDIFCVNGHRIPNFFLIGSQKCGTTSIAAVFWRKAPKKVKGAVYCVNSESASNFCVKEPHFFNQHEDVLLHDERYVKLFPKCEDSADVIFDATPNNAQYTNRIEKFYNQAQKKEILFVKVVCDPVKRYESAWNHCARDGYKWGKETIECQKNISIDEQIDWSIKAENEMIRFGYYDEDVQSLRRNFPNSQILIVSNKYFFANQAEVTNLISKLSGGPMMDIEYNYPPSNESKEKKKRIGDKTRKKLREHYHAHLMKFQRLVENDEKVMILPDNVNLLMTALLDRNSSPI